MPLHRLLVTWSLVAQKGRIGRCWKGVHKVLRIRNSIFKLSGDAKGKGSSNGVGTVGEVVQRFLARREL